MTMPQGPFSTGHIEYLARDFLDEPGSEVEISPDITYYPRHPVFLRITGISRFWEADRDKVVPLRRFMEEILTGLHEGQTPFIFAVLGTSDRTEIFFGTYESGDPQAGSGKGTSLETLKDTLRSAFQGISYEVCAAEDFQQRIARLPEWSLLTGSPSEKVENRLEFEQIERLIRGLYGKDWGYIVIAYPLKNHEINILYDSVLNEQRVVYDALMGLQYTSPIAKDYQLYLDVLYSKFVLAKITGMWHTAIYLLSGDRERMTQVKAVAKSIFSGRDSSPDRIRTIPLPGPLAFPALLNTPGPAPPGTFRYPYRYMNLTMSWDLSCFVHLPTQEMPGYQVKPHSRFSVATKPGGGQVIRIGTILDQDIDLGIPYQIPVKELNKHGLIVGTTGSGKTNTIFYLIREFSKQGIPFLIIEPVKTEYRKMLQDKELGKDLQVFTLGDNNLSPFRINPFEVIPGMQVQTHIELLKSVFNASFFMWGPLPHVLERCIHEIYTDKGWDLTTNTNPRGTGPNANPTLSDLYNKVEEVVGRLGYSQETTMEVRGALKTRIDSMRIGGKGLMLDTRRTIPFETLMNRPTVLELEAMGDDEEKCFLMGIILTRMYEEYITRGLTEKKGLGHITIIEEAHRLLGNYHADNPYQGNTKGKAVETFTNILAEIRAYGEGFLIAEQIPTKLTPEVVKNTNLKIMHRIVAEDDRKTMAATMNIDDRGSVKVTSLRSGEAAVYSEGDWGAYHVKVPYSKVEGGSGDDDPVVAKAMEKFIGDRKHLAPYEGCVGYCSSICRYKPAGLKITEKRTFSSQLPALTLALVEQTENLPSLLTQVFEAGADEGTFAQDQKGVATCSLVQSAELYLQWLGNRYQWPFDDIERLKGLYLECCTGALTGYLADGQGISPDIAGDPKVIAFRDHYRAICTGKQPTAFCRQICNDNRCLYRFHLSSAVSDSYYHKQFVSTLNEGGDAMWENLASVSREAVKENAFSSGNEAALRKMALCYALQTAYTLPNLSRKHIGILVENLTDAISAGDAGGRSDNVQEEEPSQGQ
jgi:Helicase HerA, central domain